MKFQKYLQRLRQVNVKWPLMVRVVSGHSMVPVLPPGTHVWATPWFWKLRQGDVVILVHDGKEKIKRIKDIKDNEIYVIGDHEEASTDSRHFGRLPKNVVTGRVVWPKAPRV